MGYNCTCLHVFPICLVPGTSQDCSKNITLTMDRSSAPIDIITFAAFCFMLPVIPIARCSLNVAPVTNSPPDVVFDESRHVVVIKSWSALDVFHRGINKFECDLGTPAVQETYVSNFYSLSKFCYGC